MKDWFTVEPDLVRLMNKHFTRGRGGARIEYITRHHLAGILTTEQTWNIWQTRQASAHYVVENSGRIGQLVWDRDTAWANANPYSNARTLAIEHSNSTGKVAGNDNDPRSWNINDTVIREGARLAAALCWFYHLGRPHFGTNIRDHREFTGTSCPHWLAFGNKYHNTWMRIAREHYDWMVAHADDPDQPHKKDVLIDMNETELKNIIYECLDVYVGPIGSDVKDIRQQLTGGRDRGEYPGYPQIDDRAVVDALAKIGVALDIEGFEDIHNGSLKAQQGQGQEGDQ